MKDKKGMVLPGDRLAISEEFLPGAHAYDDSGMIRSLTVGRVERDPKRGEIWVRPAAVAKGLKVGDYVTGQVEVAQTSSAGVRIYYVNGGSTDKGFTGSLSLRNTGPRGSRKPVLVKLGDIVRCRVFSLMNGMIHISIDEDNTGVVFALCGNCGKPLLRGGNRAKCDECGNVEERKLANDFGNTPIRP